MATTPRDRTTIDLRGLGPALKAYARARSLTVSEVARLALVAVLDTTVPHADVRAGDDRPVKLTIRLRLRVAARLKERARSCGLSHGAYLTTLIDETPARPLAVATALGTSTEPVLRKNAVRGVAPRA
jgi:hypothetical protein